jgi:putative zinc finger protein
MDCKQIKILIDAFIDNELDINNSIEVMQHISTCHSCSIVYKNNLALHSALNDESLYFTPPADLKKNILTSIKGSEKKQFNFKTPAFGWRSAAAFALTTVVLIIMILFKGPPSPEGQLTEQIVDNHMRSLMPNHLTDVQNSDQHTVKPWFNGKLDFSPPVTDLSSQGFLLVGGRLDYINGQPVAAIVYQRKSHFINLFFWFSDNKEGVTKKASVTKGYNLIHWTNGNRNYWAVSDLNLSELDEFVNKIRETEQ